MLFNSWVFVLFLLIVIPLYFSLRQPWQNRLLLAASYVFYGSWDYRFLSLLATSTVVDYICALRIQGAAHRRQRLPFLLMSLVVNLGLLGFFKYFNFFVASTAGLLEALGFQAHTPILNVILPVGISFYTFQTMAYTIDVYRGKETATRDFSSFALYVSYFPQLVAGPIERPSHLLPQIQSPRRVTNWHVQTALQLILMGYFKKVFVADSVAPLVDRCFSDPSSGGSLTLLLGLYLFAIQIYGDFAGYTDIARGVSRLLGINLSVNFQQPYLSANITEFWRRWHISLSSWLRDYLYIPLGGNRRGRVRTYWNLMLTMLLGGLWHGAGWTFVIWGGLHGLYLSVHKMLSGGRKIGLSERPQTGGAWAVWAGQVILTFHLVCLTWIFFRAPALPGAMDYLRGIVALSGDSYGTLREYGVYCLVYGGAILGLDLLRWWSGQELPFTPACPTWVRGLAYATMIFLLSFVGAADAAPFIYFQF